VTELGVLLKEPANHFIGITVLVHLRFKVVEDRYMNVRLFTLSLLVCFNNSVALLKLSLVSSDLISCEGEASEVVEHWGDIFGG
jgi:hypothetical protein